MPSSDSSTNIQNISVNDLIRQLRDSREIVNVAIPSMESLVPFYALNTLQQKTLIKTLVEDHVTNRRFYEELNKVIIENMVDNSLDPADISIYDRDAIAIQLRIASLGDDFELEDEKEKKVTISLSTLVIEPRIFDNLTVEEDGLKITLGMPNIIDDEVYNRLLNFNKTMDVEAITASAIEAVYLKIAEHMVAVEKIATNKYFNCRNDASATLSLVQNLPSKTFKKIYKIIQTDYIDPYNKLLEINNIRMDIKQLFSVS